MADEPTDAVPQILSKIQDSIGVLRSEVGQFRSDFTTWLERIESIIHKQRRDAAATMVMMRATVGHFNERLSAVEERVTVLETPKT